MGLLPQLRALSLLQHLERRAAGSSETSERLGHAIVESGAEKRGMNVRSAHGEDDVSSDEAHLA